MLVFLTIVVGVVFLSFALEPIITNSLFKLLRFGSRRKNSDQSFNNSGRIENAFSSIIPPYIIETGVVINYMGLDEQEKSLIRKRLKEC